MDSAGHITPVNMLLGCEGYGYDKRRDDETCCEG